MKAEDRDTLFCLSQRPPLGFWMKLPFSEPLDLQVDRLLLKHTGFHENKIARFYFLWLTWACLATSASRGEGGGDVDGQSPVSFSLEHVCWVNRPWMSFTLNSFHSPLHLPHMVAGFPEVTASCPPDVGMGKGFLASREVLGWSPCTSSLALAVLCLISAKMGGSSVNCRVRLCFCSSLGWCISWCVHSVRPCSWGAQHPAAEQASL